MTGVADGQTIKFRGILVCTGGDHTSAIYFLTEDSYVPKCSYLPAYKRGVIYLPFKDMPPFVDMLRNEKPIYAYLNSERPEWNQLNTSAEPVGEAERPIP
jgi:hypothetical protein